MRINVGDRLPEGVLYEFIETESEDGCALGPTRFQVSDLLKGKNIVIFGLPGAFTRTCSSKHLPGYLAHTADFSAQGVDEIWCLSVNDAHVMGAWGREHNAAGKVRMMADGSALYIKQLGLEVDLTDRGMGIRSRRFSMLVEDGVVRLLNVEAPGGKFEVSDAQTLLNLLPENRPSA